MVKANERVIVHVNTPMVIIDFFINFSPPLFLDFLISFFTLYLLVIVYDELEKGASS